MRPRFLKPAAGAIGSFLAHFQRVYLRQLRNNIAWASALSSSDGEPCFLQGNFDGFPVMLQKVKNRKTDNLALCVDTLENVRAYGSERSLTPGEGHLKKISLFVKPHS
jgi:hypothetical protein